MKHGYYYIDLSGAKIEFSRKDQACREAGEYFGWVGEIGEHSIYSPTGRVVSRVAVLASKPVATR